MQTPPMYSALHVNGERLYDLARRGEKVEVQPRKVTVYNIERITPLENNSCKIRITCSKGTYIRTICDDLGQKLGCGAFMAHLIRENAGGLSIENALTIEQIQQCVAQGDFSFIKPTEEAASFLPKVVFSADVLKKLQNGNPVSEEYLVEGQEHKGSVRIYCGESFFGIGERRGEKYYLKCMLGGVEK